MLFGNHLGRECSSPEDYISRRILRDILPCRLIPIAPNTDDARSYLEMRLGRDAEPEAMNGGSRADIMRTVLERISDIYVAVFATSTLSAAYLRMIQCRFLPASLHMDSILGVLTIRQRRR